MATDHFSRKVVACCPLEGPNAGWVVGAIDRAFLCHGPTKHIITDREGEFISDAFAEILARREVKQRFGAVSKHCSIAVAERVILTLKHEWLTRVPMIKGLGHLWALPADFACYYNGWRPHTTLKGAVPDLIHPGQQWSVPPKTGKTAPDHVERRLFPDTQITAYRLAA